MENKWNIIHDIAVVYQYFMELGNENESNFMNSLMRMEEEIEKWEFKINNELYGLKHRNPENYDVLYDLMMSQFVPLQLDQMNSSMENLVNYFNAGVFDGGVINLLFNSIHKCIGEDICEGQIHQMEYYTKMWMPVSPDLKILNHIMQFKLNVNNPESLINDMVDDVENKTDENRSSSSEFNFISLSDLDQNTIPDCAGIYAFRILNINSLPEPFPEILSLKDNRYFYIGQSSKSLFERMYKQELNGKKHGTFFRSLGAVLGFLPAKGSLLGRDTRNYKFSKEDTLKIVEWLREYVEVGFFTETENLDQIESDLIKKYTPLLNIQGNPKAIPEISELRKKCVEFAKSE